MPATQEPEAAPETLDEYRARLHAEWNSYTAAHPIQIDGVPAFNAGDPVPLGHVVRGVVDLADVNPTPQPSDEVDGNTPKDV